MSDLNEKKWGYIITGSVSTLCTIVVIAMLFVCYGGFRYRNIVMLDTNQLSKEEVQTSITVPEAELLNQLHQKGVLMTPSEYTGHLATYYDTLVAFLAILFVLFSVIGYFGIQNISRKEVAQVAKDVLNDSYELKTGLKTMIMGEIDENMVLVEDYQTGIQQLEEKLDECVAEVEKLKASSSPKKEEKIIDPTPQKVTGNGNKRKKSSK